MAGLRFLLAVAFGLLGTAAASVNLTQANIDSSCNNNCFFHNMNGSCANDPACICDQQKYRENYLCCMAKDCSPTTLPEALDLLHTDCSVRNMDFTFDVEEVCGITLSTSSATKTTSMASTSTTDSISTTSASATASTDSSAAKSSATMTGTTSGTTSSGSAPSSTSNAASVRRIAMEALVAPIAALAML